MIRLPTELSPRPHCADWLCVLVASQALHHLGLQLTAEDPQSRPSADAALLSAFFTATEGTAAFVSAPSLPSGVGASSAGRQEHVHITCAAAF